MTTIPPPKFEDLMLRNFAEIVRLDDAMEIICSKQNDEVCDTVCPLLAANGVHCNRKFLHGMIVDIKKEMPKLQGDQYPPRMVQLTWRNGHNTTCMSRWLLPSRDLTKISGM